MFVKKPIGIGLVIGLLALAFTALPAMAQASPTLRSGGAILPVGSHVVATSTNLVTVTSVGELKCSKVTLTGEVTSNPPAKIGNGTGTATGCVAKNPLGEFPVEITTIEFEDEFFAGGTDSAGVFFEYDIPAAGLFGCFLEGSTVGTTWTNGSSNVGIPAVAGNLSNGGGGAGCPTAGTLSGTLALETDAASPVAVTVNNE